MNRHCRDWVRCLKCNKNYRDRGTVKRHYLTDHTDLGEWDTFLANHVGSPVWVPKDSTVNLQSEASRRVVAPAQPATLHHAAFPAAHPETPPPAEIPVVSGPVHCYGQNGFQLPPAPQEIVLTDQSADDLDSQLRSSRITRNQEHNQPARNRAGFIDYDPTDGLPVRRWIRESVKINQDAPLDSSDTTNSTAKPNESENTFPELEMPSWAHQLPQYSQELLRRARMPDQNVTLSVWDKKKQEWIPGREVEARRESMKSKLLANIDNDGNDNEDDDDDEQSGDEDDGITSNKRRKLANGFGERLIETKKWVSVPIEKADTIPEPKYLADRRPGMPSLYTSAYKNTSGYGAIGASTIGNNSIVGNTAGFDLGDGSGLGQALGGATDGNATPVRKNMPPRRKKKKLGGPGRKKAVQPIEQSGDVEMGDIADNNHEKHPAQADENEAKEEGDEEDGSGSESEDGSEEGEIEEGTKNEDAAVTALAGAATVIGPEGLPATDDIEKIITEKTPPPVVPVIVETAPEAGFVSAPIEVVESTVPTPPPPAEEGTGTEEVEAKESNEVPTVVETANEGVEETDNRKEDQEMDLLGGLEAAVDGMEKE